jgi:hypothetical protein
VYNTSMVTVLDREFNKLARIVEKYCIAGKEDKVIECVEWARNYVEDLPENADIEEAISLLKKAERYLSDEGKPLYAAVRERVVKRLGRMLAKQDPSIND